MLNRPILAKIWKNIDNDLVLLLNGARQTGKTTILHILQQKLVQEKGVLENQILDFDLEKTEDLAIWSAQESALAVLPKDTSKKYYLFIDEFHYSKKIGSILKLIHDHHSHIKPIITGSASWYLGLDESMAGRKLVIDIWPLSFAEYLEWTSPDKLWPLYKKSETLIQKNLELIDVINQTWLSFLTFGGYPAVVLAQDKIQKAEILSELLNSFILKDIKLWNYAANSLEVKKLLTILSSSVGSVASIESLGLKSGLGRTALKNRLELLQNTFVLLANQPFFTNKLKELVKSPKFYLVDSGLRNLLLDNFSIQPQTKDFGYLAENTVVTEFYKNVKLLDKIYYWRTKTGQEVDIVRKRENILLPIEVKTSRAELIPTGLKSFIKQYQPRQAYVLNWDMVKDISFEGTIVKFRPLWFPIE